MAVKKILCPICKRKVSFDDPNMPFCSERCRDIDLGNWATEKYAIPGGQPTELEEYNDSERAESEQ